MKIYMVHVTDLSRLGGPMGSEYTEEISRTSCMTVTVAERVFRAQAARHRLPENRLPKRIKLGKNYDFGYIGLSIEAVEVVTE